MKHRITLSIDPAITRRAKKLAHARQTSVSALVEQFLRSTPIVGGAKSTSFVERWTGKFTVARTERGDLRLKALKARYRLNVR